MSTKPPNSNPGSCDRFVPRRGGPDARWQCVFDCLDVNWPLLCGETQRFKDLPIDCYIAILEGEEKWK
jgi:hypothetical protein